jgi:hypothetical protein
MRRPRPELGYCATGKEGIKAGVIILKLVGAAVQNLVSWATTRQGFVRTFALKHSANCMYRSF